MDVNLYPLVPLPPDQRALVPVTFSLISDEEAHATQADFFAKFWRAFGKLALLLWLAILLIRRLRNACVELRWQANYWRAMHRRAVQREAELAQEVQRLQAEIREWERRVYGRKSETANATQPPAPNSPGREKPTPRPRGQQPNSKGHGRRNHDHLPARDETCDLPDDQKCCPDCQEPFEEIPGTADGTILEIEVRAHRRVYHRQRYRRH
jgi:hypothetical protein